MLGGADTIHLKALLIPNLPTTFNGDPGGVQTRVDPDVWVSTSTVLHHLREAGVQAMDRWLGRLQEGTNGFRHAGKQK
jgi:hypothetical protein